MPYIEEEVLEKLKTDLELEVKKNEFQEKSIKKEQKEVKKYKLSSIILGVLALLGIIVSVYLAFSGPSEQNSIQKTVNEEYIKSLEDSIQTLSHQIENDLVDSDTTDTTNETVATEVDNDAQESLSDSDLTVYTIQIAAFEEKGLSLYSDGFVNFREIKADDYNKYALGNFETLEEAQAFRNELVALGFERSFIASYRNGRRIQIEPTE